VSVGSSNFCVVYNVLGTLGPLRDAQYAVCNTYSTGMQPILRMGPYPVGMLTYLFKEE
jgi:hypothetical protein